MRVRGRKAGARGARRCAWLRGGACGCVAGACGVGRLLEEGRGCLLLLCSCLLLLAAVAQLLASVPDSCRMDYRPTH